MQAILISEDEINSDLGVVNAARVSLAKKSEWAVENYTYPEETVYANKDMKTKTVAASRYFLKKEDVKLIQYLASHNHWTPFAHSRLYFEIHWRSAKEELEFRRMANLAGMAWRYRLYPQGKGKWKIRPLHQYWKGSLFSWTSNLKVLPQKVQDEVIMTLMKRYPVSTEALVPFHWDFPYLTGVLNIDEKYLILKKEWYLATATLYIKVPLFVARQIRTSQVGFAYSDSYVEGEAFSFNEVSRRYVSDEPDFYIFDVWRERKGTRVKQGSTGVLGDQVGFKNLYSEILEESAVVYTSWVNECAVAPEQARALLPQSMYTEFYMTGTLHRWAQFLALRLQPDVQEETRAIAHAIAAVLSSGYPGWGEWYHLPGEKK